jgi:hypothetical protein
MATLPESKERHPKSGNVVTMATESGKSGHGNGEAYDSDECVLPPRVKVRGSISVKKEAAVMWEDV